MELEQFRQARGPVVVLRLPHNFRDPLYAADAAPSTFCTDTRDERDPPLGEVFTDLPMPMPRCVICSMDGNDVVIAATADGRRIRWKDLDTVMLAVEQFNEDCARLGIMRPPMQELEPPVATPEVWHDGEPPAPQ
jgi:hypothetical protein